MEHVNDSHVGLLIGNLVTGARKGRRPPHFGHDPVIPDGAVLVDGKQIAFAGKASELPRRGRKPEESHDLTSATPAVGSVAGSPDLSRRRREPTQHIQRSPHARMPQSEDGGIRSDQLSNVAVTDLGTLLTKLRTDTVVSDCHRPSPGDGCARGIRGTGPPNTTRRPHTAGGVRRASQALLLVIEALTGSRWQRAYRRVATEPTQASWFARFALRTRQYVHTAPCKHRYFPRGRRQTT